MFLALLCAVTLSWQQTLPQAMEQAAAEKRLILAAVANDCHGCDRELTRFLNVTMKRAPIAHSYRQFVLWRPTPKEEEAHGIRVSARAAMIVLDPAGRRIATWLNFDDMNGYAAFLSALRQERTNLIRAAQMRLSGDHAYADFFVANALLNAGLFADAAPLLDQAARELSEIGDQTGAEWARLRQSVADFGLQRNGEAIERLEQITRDPVDRQNAAMAWLILAENHRSQKRPDQAAEALANAHRLADAGSGAAEAAGTELDLLKRRKETEARQRRAARAIAALDVPFAVHITSPADERVEGPVTVAAVADIPPARILERVDLYFNEEKIATRTTPPFEAKFEVPDGKFGYFRAVALLDDGSRAEATQLVNSGGAEQIEVQGVHFVASVYDRSGARITGLTADDFEVREDGYPVKVAVDASQNEPVTIGIALDTSASIRGHLLDVQEIAAALADEAGGGNGTPFVVAFDSRPRLLTSATNDVELVKQKIFDVRAGGATSIYDAIAYSMRFFSRVRGKRALVVLSDGIDTTSGFSSEVAAEAAREAGVPVYVVLHGHGSRTPVPMGNILTVGAMPTQGHPLQKIVYKTGGRIFVRGRRERLDDAFRMIREEVNAQYVLSYQSRSRKVKGAWREVTVEVPGRGATVKSISGYVPR